MKLLNIEESKITVKRKYTELHPERKVNKKAKIRNQILELVASRGKIKLSALKTTITEYEGGAIKTINNNWIESNKDLFHIFNEDGVDYCKLSKKGMTIYNSLQINEFDK